MDRAGFSDWPFAALYALFFVAALGRGSLTYLAGRGLRGGTGRLRGVAARLDRPSLQRAERVVARWGAPVVALSFLTVGFQTAANAAAGALRMPWRRYLPGVVVGALLWALVYTTVGFAVVELWVGGGWPYVVAAAVLLALVAAATAWWRRRRRA
ncbi:VTT domain-containing protein [Lapillicoccus jejuensis]|uniref:Membrane protein DedA with SNARE-associated domain n=1 Tax=Lapillicoccus jejuensis TaxID=402171 RepID=A0A542E332_9MICO|nr:VTT domain-containing protein [Lapillicoccus jejuensis]TQJ09737.1 membrane protein DedA with SNARE-associated domain [Lapillicoccus jejuensis]